MKNKSLCAIVFLFSLLPGPAVWAATYYVDKNHPSASNNNPGTEDFPWKTIGKAAGVANAGDTVYIKAGIYNERPYFLNSGSESNKIVIRNHENDSVPGYAVKMSGPGMLIYPEGK
jgi:hypothetical protein